jgi:hypothetical protein
MITVWATYRNLDMTEGRGPMIMDKVFLNEEDAHVYVNEQEGVLGRRPSDFGKTGWEGMGEWEVKPLIVLDSVRDAQEHDRELALRSAYSKLTEEERKAIEFHIRTKQT